MISISNLYIRFQVCHFHQDHSRCCLLSGPGVIFDRRVRGRRSESSQTVCEQREDPDGKRKPCEPADSRRCAHLPPLAGLSPALCSDHSQLPQGTKVHCFKAFTSIIITSSCHITQLNISPHRLYTIFLLVKEEIKSFSQLPQRRRKLDLMVRSREADLMIYLNMLILILEVK